MTVRHSRTVLTTLLAALTAALLPALSACRFSSYDNLVDYLQNGGVLTTNPDSAPFRTLKPVTATQCTLPTDGEPEPEPQELTEGAVYESERTVKLLAPTQTVKNTKLPSTPSVTYRLWRFNRNTNNYSLLASNDQEKAAEHSLEQSSTILETGLLLDGGKYLLEALAKLAGYTDSESTVWNFSIGWEEVTSLQLELPDNYRCYYIVGRTVFSADTDSIFSQSDTDDVDDNGGENAGRTSRRISVNPQVYKLTGTSADGSESKELVPTPDNLPAPLLWLETQEGDTAVQPVTGYTLVLPADLPAEEYKLRIQVIYANVTNDLTVYVQVLD